MLWVVLMLITSIMGASMAAGIGGAWAMPTVTALVLLLVAVGVQLALSVILTIVYWHWRPQISHSYLTIRLFTYSSFFFALTLWTLLWVSVGIPAARHPIMVAMWPPALVIFLIWMFAVPILLQTYRKTRKEHNNKSRTRSETY